MIRYRLRDLEARIDSSRFIRLGRGTIVNVDIIRRIIPLPGGTYTVILSNAQEFKVSRIQSQDHPGPVTATVRGRPKYSRLDHCGEAPDDHRVPVRDHQG